MADPTTSVATTTFADQAMAHMSSLHPVALRRTRNPDDADDLVRRPISGHEERAARAATNGGPRGTTSAA